MLTTTINTYSSWKLFITKWTIATNFTEKLCSAYSYFEKDCRKKVHATIPKGNMGYDQYTVSDTVAVEPTFAASLYHQET